MIEYLFDAIRADAGIDAVIAAQIADSSGAAIVDNCSLMLSDDSSALGMFDGVYSAIENTWYFTIPAKVTADLRGRYWYCIHHGDNTLCFKNPLYLL